MKSVTTIGIDLAKNSFSVYGVNANGKPVLQRTLGRAGVVTFFANLPSCLVGMEACSGSEYWARTIESLGHEVRRIHPRYVKAYLFGAKNDTNDAAAICEAVQRPKYAFCAAQVAATNGHSMYSSHPAGVHPLPHSSDQPSPWFIGRIWHCGTPRGKSFTKASAYADWR